MRIVHLSDIHYNGEFAEEHNFIKLIEDLKSENRKKKIDFVVITGDLVDKGGEKFNSLTEAFQKFKENRLNVIAKELDLGKEQIIFCIGNHDINRNQIDEFTEEGLRCKLKDEGKVNEFIEARYSNLDNSMARIKEYKDFEKEYSEDNINCSITNFESNYCLNIGGQRVGVSAFNTCWRCSGREDHNFLILGESQIKNSIKYLLENKCDIKIALMHHSYEMLQDFELRNIKNGICNNYDYLFIGHVHTNDSYLKQGLLNDIFVSVAQSNSITWSKDDSILYSLGYSIVDLDFELEKIIVWGRRYSNEIGTYVRNVDMYGDNGFREYYMIRDSKKNEKRNLYNTLELIRENYIDTYNEHLLSYSTDSNAPKTINEIFVQPSIVGEKKEGLDTKEKEKKYRIEDICSLGQDTMILGCRESGKTILLDRVMIEFVEKYDLYGKLPIRIDLNDLKTSRIETAIKRYVSVKKGELKNILNSGDVVLLVDNIDCDINFNKNLKLISDFRREYPKVRFIFAINTRIEREIPIEIINNEFFSNFIALYILAWRSNEINNIIDRWFLNQQCVTVKEIISIFEQIKMSMTPLNISMFLWIIEHQNNYKLINKGKLMECFFEHLLEKLYTGDSYSDTFDYTNKIRLLSAIAYNMYQNGYKLEKIKLYKFTKDYLKARKFAIDYTRIIDYFIDKGIFIEEVVDQEHFLVFRFECFYRFFISQYMLYNPEFRTFVFSESNYLDFQDEIEYYTGLKRDETQYLKDIVAIMDKKFKKIEEVIFTDNRKIDSYYEVDKSICDLIDTKDIERLTSSKKDINKDEIIILEDNKKIENISNEVAIGTVREKKISSEIDDLMDTWTLVAKMLKNTEETDEGDIKNLIYKKVIYSSMIFFVLYKAVLDKAIEEQLIKKSGSDEYQIIKDMKVTSKMIPLINSEMVKSLLSTTKLEIVLDEEIKNSLLNFKGLNSELEVYISIFLMMNINKDKGMKYLEKFLTLYEELYLKDLIFFEVMHEYFITNSKEFEKKCTNILLKLKFTDVKDRNIKNRTIYKSKVLEQLESEKNKYRQIYDV